MDWKLHPSKPRNLDEGEALVTGPLLWLLMAAAFGMMALCAIGLCADRRPERNDGA